MLLLTISLLYACAVSLPVKVINVDDLQSISQPHAHPIFDPHFLSRSGKESKHNLHIMDKFGKFMKLKYESKVHDHVRVWHLDEMGVELEDVECGKGSDYIEITFEDHQTADDYYKDISNDDNIDAMDKHFLIASAQWRCHSQAIDSYSSIINEVIAAELFDNTLKLRIAERSFVDLFENLDLFIETNHLRQHLPFEAQNHRRLASSSSCEVHFDEVSYDAHHTKPRRIEKRKKTCHHKDILKCIFTKKKVKKAFKKLGKGIAHAFNFLTGGGLKKAKKALHALWKVAALEARLVADAFLKKTDDIKDTTTYHLGINYDATTESAVCKRFELSDGVYCENCFFSMDLSYTFEIKIVSGKFKRISAIASGDVKLAATIVTETEMEAAYKKQTDAYDTGLTIYVQAIPLEIKVKGEFMIGGVFFEKNIFGAYFYGNVEEGIIHDSGKKFFHSIKKQPHLQWKSRGPQFEQITNRFKIYESASIYIILEKIGSVHLTLQPHVDAALHYDENDMDCAQSFTIIPSIAIFIGGELAPADILLWTLEDIKFRDIPLKHLRHHCITLFDLVSASMDLDAAVDELVTNYQVDGSRRRLAVHPHFDSDIMYNFTSIERRWHPEMKWGQNFTTWRANLTLLDETCPPKYEKTDSTTGSTTEFTVILPDSAHLKIWSEHNDGEELMALYTVSKEMTQEDGFSIDANITCSFTYLLTQLKNAYPSKERVDRYSVELYTDGDDDDNHTVCDHNESLIYDSHGDIFVTFTLPPVLDAIHLDSSFGKVLLMDDNWLHCHSFILSQDAVEHNTSLINKTALVQSMRSIPWSGAFHCAHRNFTDKLNFAFDYIDLEPVSNRFAAWITLIDGDYYAYGDGYVDMENLHARLNVTGWFQQVEYNDTADTNSWNETWDWNITDQYIDAFELVGFISVLEEGWLLYSGVLYHNKTLSNCTGFVFQTKINLQKVLIDAEENNDDDDSDVDEEKVLFCVDESNQLYAYGIAGVVLLLFIVLLICLICTCRKAKAQMPKAVNTMNHNL